MKKIIALLLTTFLAITFETYAQCSDPTISSTQTVYTAKNSAVQGLILTPLSSQCYNDAVNYRRDTYPNSIVVENPTSEYNCHGFAFHLSEGNTNKGNLEIMKYPLLVAASASF